MPIKGPASRTHSVSVIITVHNGGEGLRDCLASLARNREQFEEFLVVDDGSTEEGVSNYAAEFHARVLRVGSRRGPANGRNVGALAATGDIVLFLDADVCVHENTIPKIRQRFEEDPELGAVFGSYDSEPDAPGFVSQFRNLLHCFVHQTGKHCASTFWAGCGAIRRDIFLQFQGFDISYSVPCVEDIELGTRLVKQGVNVALDPSIQVKHLKCWTLRTMVVTDIVRRGIPWTRHILASHRMPNDLNLRFASRVSVALTAVLSILLWLFALGLTIRGAGMLVWMWEFLLPVVLALIVGVNLPFYQFLVDRRGYWFAMACVPLHLIYFFACGTAFVLGAGIYASSQRAATLQGNAMPSTDTVEDSRS